MLLHCYDCDHSCAWQCVSIVLPTPQSAARISGGLLKRFANFPLLFPFHWDDLGIGITHLNQCRPSCLAHQESLCSMWSHWDLMLRPGTKSTFSDFYCHWSHFCHWSHWSHWVICDDLRRFFTEKGSAGSPVDASWLRAGPMCCGRWEGG